MDHGYWILDTGLVQRVGWVGWVRVETHKWVGTFTWADRDQMPSIWP